MPTNLKKVVRKENKTRKKNAMGDAAQKAADAGKGSAKRLTGYFTTKGSETNNMVKPREARPYARAAKKEATATLRTTALRKAIVEKKASTISGVKKRADYSAGKSMRLQYEGAKATNKGKEAGLSDKKMGKIQKKAARQVAKRK
jgi:hypothetical protein